MSRKIKEETRKMIYQQFIFSKNIKEILNEEDENSMKQNYLPPFRRWLRASQALKKLGLHILVSGNSNASIAISDEIMVGIEAQRFAEFPLKDSFMELAQKFNLPYRSGSWYLEI